jgi:hypothetical protein
MAAVLGCHCCFLDQQRPFINQSATLQLKDLSLLSTHGSTFDGTLERQRHAHLVLPYTPELASNDCQVDRQIYRFQKESLFLSQEQSRLHVHASFCVAVVVTFPPKSLRPVAIAMAGPPPWRAPSGAPRRSKRRCNAPP